MIPVQKSKRKKRRYVWPITNRMILMVALGVIEFLLLYNVFHYFQSKAPWIEEALNLASAVIILLLVTRSKHLSSDMLWILLIVLMPVFGTAMYLFLSGNLFISGTFRSIQESTLDARKYFKQDPEVLEEMCNENPELKGQFRYLAESSKAPFYRNEGFEYYPSGEAGFPRMLEELRKAEKFIFLEYFIVEEGEMWFSILDILEEKAAQGVDVRVMYDDLGSIGTLPPSYVHELEKKGIKAITFNRINPILNIIMNHRDHRKIMVIDGKVAFSGGINLADEYINQKERFGYWKDNVMMVKGEAVWSYTVLFLTNWNALRKEDTDYTKFKAEFKPVKKHDGYVSAYGETPFDDDLTSQNVYLNIINQANDYVYIATPYLIVDTEMLNALILAAKRGVDVRIITPGIPDKKIVWFITRSFYSQLVEGGVKIYEYTPGFIHSKVFVSDDVTATVGTINLDYRSLYLHFENGTYLYGSKKVLEVKDDMVKTIEESHRMEKKECDQGVVWTLVVSIIRLFAPLM